MRFVGYKIRRRKVSRKIKERIKDFKYILTPFIILYSIN